jgi:hypothetical protein
MGGHRVQIAVSPCAGVRYTQMRRRRHGMKDEQPIDIMQQFVDMYAREEMLCFFDFGIARPGQSELSGLCRISKPKQGQSSLRYLSMVFVVDTPDDASRREVQALFARLEGDSLRVFVPQIAEVLAVPAPTTHRENYVHQIDLLLDADIEPDERFVSAMLLPAVRKLGGMRTSEMVWWEDNPSDEEPAAPNRGERSFLDGLRRVFDRGERPKQ